MSNINERYVVIYYDYPMFMLQISTITCGKRDFSGLRLVIFINMYSYFTVFFYGFIYLVNGRKIELHVYQDVSIA